MRKISRAAAFILIFSILLGAVIPAYAAIIQPSSDFYITDYTQSGVISDSTKQYIISMNEQLEDETGAQIVVAVVDFIDGADIENYAYEVFNDWEIGDSEQNNGLLILLVIGEQNYWGVQGAGISEALPASLVAEYFNTYLENDFAAAHYDSGVRSVFDAFLNWYSGYYSVVLNAPMEDSATDEIEEPVVVDLPSSNIQPVTEEDEGNNTESILAVGFLLGKIAKWFLICLASAVVLVFLLATVKRRRVRSGGVRRGLFSSMFRRRHIPTAPPPPHEPINRYNSLYRNSSPDGQYHYSKPTNGLTHVNPEYKSGFSQNFHQNRPNPQPNANKYDNLYRFNARPNNSHTPNNSRPVDFGGSRPSGFGNNSRPSGFGNSSRPGGSSFRFGNFGGGHTSSRPSQSHSSSSRGSSSPHTGGGGFTRGGGAGRHR